MTLYVMTAEENYSSTIGAGLSAGSLPMGGLYTNSQTLFSLGYNPVTRTIVYGIGYNPSGTTPVTNATGFKLWSGNNGINAGATYREDSKRNFNVLTKQIDTGAVTFFTEYDASSVVPNGVDGSNGTWRRYIESTAGVDQNPHIVDVQTGNLWCHFLSSGCAVECLRLSDSYAKTLSPFTAGGIFLWGLSDAWAYIPTVDTPNFLLNLVPRLRTAAETTADHLLSYAQYDSGVLYDPSTIVWSACAGGNQKLYVLFLDTSGMHWNFFLKEFTEPSAFVYPTPPVDGGLATVTPWGSTDGPNNHAAAWSGNTSDWSTTKLMWLHATNRLVVLNAYAPRLKTGGSSNPNDWHFQCGYFTPSTSAWTFTGDFVTGYMTSAWAMTSSPPAAAYAVRQSSHATDVTGIRFSDQYRDYNAHAISDLVMGDDDSQRLFYFEVNPVSGGVIDTATQLGVFAVYQFDTAGVAAPALVDFWPTQGWTDAYPTYAAFIGGDVVQLTLYDQSVVGDGEPTMFKDDFVWDSANNAIWASGQYGTFFDFDPTFAVRENYQASAPWMRLSFSSTPPPAAGQGCVYNRTAFR